MTVNGFGRAMNNELCCKLFGCYFKFNVFADYDYLSFVRYIIYSPVR
jgi:hypothetical protein